MNSPSPQAVVLTTSSPGVAWFALVAAGIEAGRASVITRPGAAVDASDRGLAREIGAALALTGARQLLVITYKQDTVFQLGSRGLGNLARKAGADPGRWSREGEARIPGLDKNADTTVIRAVESLSRAPWMPPGLAVLGVVVDRDGSHENVALKVVGESAAATATAPPAQKPPTPEPPAPEPQDRSMEDLEPHPLEGLEPAVAPAPDAAPWPTVDGGLEESFFSESGQPEGPVATVEPPASPPAKMGGPPRSGPVGLGGALTGGPIGLGGSTSQGPASLGEMAESGPVGLGGSSLGQASSLSPAAGAIVSRGALGSEHEVTPEPVPAAAPAHDPDDLLAGWIADEKSRSVAEMDRPVGDPESGDIDSRLASSMQLLHHFLRSQSFQPPIDKDMRELERQGASPEALMRHLKILVSTFAGDRADVRAAFGTLEMAQTLLTREDLSTLLRRILR